MPLWTFSRRRGPVEWQIVAAEPAGWRRCSGCAPRAPACRAVAGTPDRGNANSLRLEQKARAIFQRQLRLYSVGRFRLLAPDGKIVAEGKAIPLFSNN